MTTATHFKPAPTDPVEIATAVTALTEALTHVDDAHRRIRHRLAHDLGFSTSELTAIYLIASTENCTPKHLGLELDLSTGSITALVDRLEKSGNVERHLHPTDRRSQRLVVTPLGRQASESIMALYNKAIEEVIKTSPCVFDRGLIDCLLHAAAAIDATAASKKE